MKSTCQVEIKLGGVFIVPRYIFIEPEGFKLNPIPKKNRTYSQ